MFNKTPDREGGFSLIELMLVLLIVAILMVVGMASYAGMTRIADNKGTQLDLLTAVKVQALQHLDAGEFTGDVGVLFDLEPTLRYTVDGDPPGTIVVRSEVGRLELDVCLFSQTEQGDWFAIYHSVSSGARYGESPPMACTSGNVGAWTAEAW